MSDPSSMPFVSHLIELRKRLLHALIAIGLVFSCLFPFANELYSIVAQPIVAQLPQGSSMIATDVTATFFAPFKLCLVIAFFIAIPILLHQLWRFIAPGLYKHEKQLIYPMLLLSIILFYLGIAFAYFVIFPLVMNFFANVTPENVQVAPDISQYLSIALKLFFAFGLAFEVPVVTMLLIWSGVTDAQSLKAKRPYIIVGCFIFGMLLTPPDPFSQAMLAIPMWLLFEIGLLFGAMRKSKKKDVSEPK